MKQSTSRFVKNYSFQITISTLVVLTTFLVTFVWSARGMYDSLDTRIARAEEVHTLDEAKKIFVEKEVWLIQYGYLRDDLNDIKIALGIKQ